MATKRYNSKTFDFVVNGEHVFFLVILPTQKTASAIMFLQVEAANIMNIPACLI